MLRKICKQHTNLNEEEICVLENIESTISYFSTLSGADIFIDCFKSNDKKGIVAAHGRPTENSQYSSNITGEYVLPQNEPMVFYTKKTGIVMREAKAINQENKTVLQKTVPIKYKDRIIAVLIEETDVTKNVRRNKRLREMEKDAEQLENLVAELTRREKEILEKSTLIQEMHHRVKNNLQTICSILSMQERRIDSFEAKQILRENVNRIEGMASIHNVMMDTGSDIISLNQIIEKVVCSVNEYAVAQGKNVDITIRGDELVLDSDKAQCIVLAVNEALTNSIKHGFDINTKGHIDVELHDEGGKYKIAIKDDGKGFDAEEAISKKECMGIKLMGILIEDKLNGRMNIDSDALVTQVIMKVN